VGPPDRVAPSRVLEMDEANVERLAPLVCPSASPDWEDAELLGVVVGTADAPGVEFVAARAVTPELLALSAPVVPEEVFRFSAPCRELGCPQFVDGCCGVARAVATHLPVVADGALPRCGIRPRCRWWLEVGSAACRRCPTVVTADTARAGTAYSSAIPARKDF
jgi:hypothetical protein